DRPDERRAPRRAAQPEVVQRAPDLAAVEEADGDEVEQVEEETGVAQLLQKLRVRRLARAPDGGSPGRPDQRARERDPGVLPRVEPLAADGHERAQEGDEDRQRRVQSLPSRLQVVAHLVHEDEEDEADAELPTPDERIAADGDEDRGELREGEAELEHQPEHDPERRPDPPGKPAPVEALRVERLVVAQLARGFHARTVAARAGQDPRPIHSSPSSYTSFFHSGTVSLSRSIASRHAASASARCGAETAITTEISPTTTRPVRWAIATAVSS